MLPTIAVHLSYGWTVMGEEGIAVITVKLEHVALQTVGSSIPCHPEMTNLTLVLTSLGKQR
jgi:hypothetical protein